MRLIRRTTLPALVLAIAGCGSTSYGSGGASGTTTTTATTAATASVTAAVTTSPTTAAGFPTTVKTSSGDVVIKAKPAKIVSLSPTGTEMLFAIGAGSQVTAVDDQSNYPAAAPKTDLSGLQPNVEAIAKYAPDLVIVSDDSAGLPESLAPLGVPVLVEPPATSLDDSYAQIEQLGQATGNADGAAATVKQMRAAIDRIAAGSAIRQAPLTYYHELDDTLYSVTSKTFIGQIYSLLGLRDIADAADSTGSGYPQLSAEYLLTTDPDIIFLADTKCCHQDAATLAARPGFGELKAVKNGAVVVLDDDVASRWGPRVVEFMQTVADAVAKLQPAGG